MPVPLQVVGLALSIAHAAIKLGLRLDALFAEQAALRSDLALPLPPVALPPPRPAIRAALAELLAGSEGQEPDPLGADRGRIRAALDQNDHGTQWECCQRYDLLTVETFSPDAELASQLRRRRRSWDLDDEEIRALTFFVGPGADRRETSFSFRLAATVLDVAAELAAEQVGLLLRDPAKRRVVETALARFAEPDLASLSGWGELVRHALRSSMGALVEARELVPREAKWLETLFDALAEARRLSGVADDWVAGLLQGEGFRRLGGPLRAQASALIGRLDQDEAAGLVRVIIERGAACVDRTPGFAGAFFGSWDALVVAGASALERHGVRLEATVVEETLGEVVEALSRVQSEGLPGRETVTSLALAAVAGAAVDSRALPAAERARSLVGSVSALVGSASLLEAFPSEALERHAQAALAALERRPSLHSLNLPGAVLPRLLSPLTRASALRADALGEAVVGVALDALENDARLDQLGLPDELGAVAGQLAPFVATGTLSPEQGRALLEAVAAAHSGSPEQFLGARSGSTRAILAALQQVAQARDGLLSRAGFVESSRRLLAVWGAHGRDLAARLSPDELQAELGRVLEAGLLRAREGLGAHLDRAAIPAILEHLVRAWLQGGLEGLDLTGPEFAARFLELATRAAGGRAMSEGSLL